MKPNVTVVSTPSTAVHVASIAPQLPTTPLTVGRITPLDNIPVQLQAPMTDAMKRAICDEEDRRSRAGIGASQRVPLGATPGLSVGDSLALFNRLRHIEEQLQQLIALLTPKPKAAPKKQDPDVLNALKALAARTGVPTKPADRDALIAAIGLHGKPAMLQSLAIETMCAGNRGAAAFANRNLIAAAAARCAQRTTTPPSVATWKPKEDE